MRRSRPAHRPEFLDNPSVHALCCPDKFRGSLTAAQAAACIAGGVRRAGLDAVELPLADGGEGTLDVLVAAQGGALHRCPVTGPLGDTVEAVWALLPGDVAVVEAARACGLQLVAGRNDPVRATTAGVGELIRAAAGEGARSVLVCVGGSATTDGGLGAVEALGWSLQGLDVVVACDVETRFLEAARVFAPQKGASPAQVDVLTARLEALAAGYLQRTGADVAGQPGSGAAGGLAGGLAALGASLRPGFEVVADAVGLDAALAGATIVLTGEGRVDATSFRGKVVGGVLGRVSSQRVAVLGGDVTPEGRAGLSPEVRVVSLVSRAGSEAAALRDAAVLLEQAAADVVGALQRRR